MTYIDLQFSRTHSTQEYGYMSEQSDWITTAKAAEIMGVSHTNVNYLCREGKIRCQKWGRAWMVSREDAENYERSKRNPTWLHDENQTED